MKTPKKIISLFISILLITGQLFPVSASVPSDPLEVYENRLSELNNILGTNYVIPSVDDAISYEETVNFYQNMSLSEFDDYVYSLYELDMNSKEMGENIEEQEEEDASITTYTIGENMEEQEEQEEQDSSITTYITGEKTQRYYYEPVYQTQNWIGIRSKIGRNANDKKVYIDVIEGLSNIKSYPAYRINSFTYSFGKKKRKVKCVFNCDRLISQHLKDAAIHTIRCTFKINVNRMYASIIV